MAEVIFYTDEHVAKAIALGLRRRGANVETVVDAGLLGASDDVHLAHALAQRRVVITQDADFLRLAASGAAHAGLIYAHQNTAVGQIIRGAINVRQSMTAEDMLGRVDFV